MDEKKVDLGGYKPRDWVACTKSPLKLLGASSKSSMKLLGGLFKILFESWSLRFLSPAHVDILLHLVNDGWITIMLVRDLHTFPPSFCGLKIGLLQLLRFSDVWLHSITIWVSTLTINTIIWYDMTFTWLSYPNIRKSTAYLSYRRTITDFSTWTKYHYIFWP